MYAKHSAQNTTSFGSAADWCRRCVRMSVREPETAGENFICSRREDIPCRYCTRGARQACAEIYPKWFELTEKVLSLYHRWSRSIENRLVCQSRRSCLIWVALLTILADSLPS